MKKSYFHNRVPRSVWTNPWHFVAFGCGSGAVPVGPGTCGTLLAVPIYWLLLRPCPLSLYLAVIIIFALFAAWLSDRVSRELKVHDHPGMNLDEFVGFFVTMIAVPPGWAWIAAGFVLFRLFDIVKPPPIGWIDRHVGGGIGMVLDDVLAGLFACLIMQIVFRLWFN